ncbi:UDP-galactose:beta-d-galactoside beta-1,4-galactosyltransferase [Plakobranchus ocellatus]|uniref:Glycosyltransferase family 92 protein n=1 Tax=Plakobranchus ocellatus TaxID=259542 RepID=A0AAV4B4F7_9GAST|nr:UDP-galactose:beta-d-galactoside beta-1,4-galactosyltransferase [Plakobranchus ocellatus]
MTEKRKFSFIKLVYIGVISICVLLVFLMYNTTDQKRFSCEELLPTKTNNEEHGHLEEHPSQQDAQNKTKGKLSDSKRFEDKVRVFFNWGNRTSSPLAETYKTKGKLPSSKATRHNLIDILKWGDDEASLTEAAEKMIKEIRNSWDKNNYAKVITLRHISPSAQRPDFQAVKNLGSLLYVHAALWQGDYVRITVVKKLGVPVTNALCVLWYSTDEKAKPHFVKAVVRDLQSYNFKNACGYIKCVLKVGESKEEEIPLHVSLVDGTDIGSGLKVTLPIENRLIHKNVEKSIGIAKPADNKTESGQVVEFTVCIPTMYRFGNAGMLVEKLEMSRLLGAGRVVLYKTSVKPNVEAVLKMYMREFAAGRETLEVVTHSWKQPPITLHYWGQIAAIDDCLYRYKWNSRFMVFTDLDEFIIPLHHATWSELIADREKLSPGNAAFMIRSSVMTKDHSSPAKGFEAEALHYYSEVLRLTERDDYIWPPIQKSKVIINPAKIESIGVHHVYEGYGLTDIVPPDQAMLFHYRLPTTEACKRVKDTRVVDKYGQKLVVRLKAAWAKLKDVSSGWTPTNKTNKAKCQVKLSGQKQIAEDTYENIDKFNLIL